MSDEKVSQHQRSWQVELPEPGAVGHVVEVGGPRNPYWWVLCPATATLVLDPDDPEGGHDDGRGGYSNPFCSDGESCDWLEWHQAAARLIAECPASPLSPVEGEPTDG